MRKASVNWKNWSDFKVQHSTQLRGEDWSKIEILSLNPLARYKNCRIAECNQLYERFEKFSRCWISTQWTLTRHQSTSVTPTFSRSWQDAKPFYRNAESQKWAKHFGHTWCIGKRFCRSICIFISTLTTRIASVEFIERGAAPFIHSGEKWKTKTRSRSEMPVWTVSQNFSLLWWRRLFK